MNNRSRKKHVQNMGNSWLLPTADAAHRAFQIFTRLSSPPVANTWEGKARHLPIVEVSEVIGCTPYEWMVDFMENPSMEI